MKFDVLFIMNFSGKLEPMLIKDEKGDQSIDLSGDELGPNECVLEAKENKSKAKKMRKRKVNEAEELNLEILRLNQLIDHHRQINTKLTEDNNNFNK